MAKTLTLDERMDIALGIGLAAQLRQLVAEFQETSASSSRSEGERKRLDALLSEIQDVARRLAELISRNAPEVREMLDSVEKSTTPGGMPDLTKVNGLAMIKMRALVDSKAQGDVGKYAILASDHLAKLVSSARDRLKEG